MYRINNIEKILYELLEESELLQFCEGLCWTEPEWISGSLEANIHKWEKEAWSVY